MFWNEFVKEFVIWGARGSQGLLESRFCNESVKEFVICDAMGSQGLLEPSFLK